MADADVKLTTVDCGGANIGQVIPEGTMGKDEGKSALAGKWQMTGGPLLDLTLDGTDVSSLQAPFGGQKFMGSVEESVDKFGMHVTMGGFPMKAWMKKEGAQTVLQFSNGGRWMKQ